MDKSPWKKVSSRILLSHKRIKVFEDIVELPNGHRTDYVHFGKQGDAGMAIAVRQDGHILVQKEYSYPPDAWLYQLPAGALKEGESPETGTLRELAEEAGCTGKATLIGKFLLENRKRQDWMHVFLITDLTGTKGTADPEESFETFWFTADEIRQLIAEGEIVTYTMLSAWALYEARLTANRHR